MRVLDGDYNEITITPSSVRIYNPGTIALNENPRAFANGEIGSKLRNPLIAMTLYRNKTIEAFGTGFKRVFDVCDKENVGYSYKTEGLGFSFTFRRGPTDLLVAAKKPTYNASYKPTPELSQTESLVYEFAKEKGKITTISEVVQECNRPYVSIQRAIQGLVNKNLLAREGSKKIGYWKLK